MRGLPRLQARLLVSVLCCAVCGVAGAASGARTPRANLPRVAALRSENVTLAERIHGAILDMYALDSKLERVEEQLTSLSTQRAQIARARQSVRVRLDTSRDNLHASQRQLSLLVHSLYEQQTNDPLAVVLGAESLEEAMATLDDLGRAAQQNRQIASQSLEARSALRVLRARLAQQDARVRSLEQAATRTAASLTTAERTRRQYVSTLAAQRHLNAAQISRINARAQASAAATARTAPQAIAAPAASAPPTASAPIPVASASRTITVVATGYSMGGTTATGLPVGWGTVAVDPVVIPLGSRMTIPGYGEGVAADTGSAVQGAVVDLWFPTVEQALAWGRRVVTVTLH